MAPSDNSNSTPAKADDSNTNNTSANGHTNGVSTTQNPNTHGPQQSAGLVFTTREVTALNGSFELPMGQMMKRSTSMEVLVGDEDDIN